MHFASTLVVIPFLMVRVCICWTRIGTVQLCAELPDTVTQ